jgi:hypothetical protein
LGVGRGLIAYRKKPVCYEILRREMYTKFLSQNLKGREHSEDIGMDGKMILKLILKK